MTQLAAGSISRRQFMEGSLALGASIASSMAMANQALAAPKSGGVFRLGLADTAASETFDPATFTSNFMYAGMFGGALNTLTELSANGDVIPELAESFESSSDAKTWIFRLRKGVEFHNGKSLDAADVITSFNHHRGDDSKSGARSLVAGIRDIRADDKNTVIFELESGNVDFPYIANDFHLSIMPAKDGKLDWANGVGTGGYVLQSYEPGIEMRLARNPNYWKPGRAHFDEVVLLAMGDVTTRQNALATGQIDAMNRVDRRTIDLFARNPRIVISEVTGTQHYTLPMNTTVTPFDNNDVRLALKFAIDRQFLLDHILMGHGRIGNDHPIAPTNRYFATDIEQRQYDPDKAKFHLKKAGVGSLEVKLHTSEAAFTGAVDAAVLYKEQATKAGILIDIVREPVDGYWDEVMLKQPWSMGYWSGRPTEDWMFSIAYAAGAPWNETHWDNPRFMELLIAARAELNQDKRRDMYREMQLLVRDEGGAIIPLYANLIDAHSDKIAHETVVGTNFELDGWKALERWWFA
ncbi:hypothetical protein N182_27945 [Sinorhizobium sp. GL2]|nr:hypothetical protein N182_27945 [Sinorhizobium sp. GL2]